MKINCDDVRDYFYGRCSAEREVEIQMWLAEHAHSKDVDQIVDSLFDELHVANHKQAEAAFLKFKSRIGYCTPTPRPSRLRTIIGWTQRVAAILVIPLIITCALLYSNSLREDEWAEIVVPLGERRSLQLSDGTTLWLNAGSRVTYPRSFNERERRIFVDGELFADVARDTSHPFVISAGDVNVRVLGTKFNLRAYNTDSSVEVALVSGSVSFEVASMKCRDTVLMSSGDVVHYDRRAASIAQSSFRTDDYCAHSCGGGFHFFNLPLNDIVAQLARAFDRKIVITDPSIADVHFLALFTNNESLDEILSTLNGDGTMRITERSGVIYISKNSK